MCAILSWAGRLRRGQWRQVHRVLSEMLIASACRGTDATGFAALDRRAGLVADKAPLPSRSFVQTSDAWNRLSYPSCVVAHCRAATHGSPRTGDNRNNHPFVGSGLAVVVNGIAPNYAAVARAYSVRLRSECDSEVVLRLVEADGGVGQGLHTCLRELTGGMAVAVLDARRRSVWLARNEARPAWLLRVAGLHGWFACSTREIAEEALIRAYGRTGMRLVEFLAPVAADVVTEITSTGTLTTARSPLRAAPPLLRSLRLV